MLIKSIIFDFDRVIVNSTKIKDQAFKKIKIMRILNLIYNLKKGKKTNVH